MKVALPRNPPPAFNSRCGNETSMRLHCLLWAYQGPKWKCAWNLVFSESQKYLSYLERKPKLSSKAADVYNNFLAFLVSLLASMWLYQFHFITFFKGFLELYVYLKKYCVTRTIPIVGHAQWVPQECQRWGALQQSPGGLGRQIGLSREGAWVKVKRINHLSTMLTSRNTLI